MLQTSSLALLKGPLGESPWDFLSVLLCGCGKYFCPSVAPHRAGGLHSLCFYQQCGHPQIHTKQIQMQIYVHFPIKVKHICFLHTSTESMHLREGAFRLCVKHNHVSQCVSHCKMSLTKFGCPSKTQSIPSCSVDKTVKEAVCLPFFAVFLPPCPLFSFTLLTQLGASSGTLCNMIC